MIRFYFPFIDTQAAVDEARKLCNPLNIGERVSKWNSKDAGMTTRKKIFSSFYLSLDTSIMKY